MKTLKIIILISSPILFIAPLSAQNRADYQFRPSVHVQLPVGTNGLGVAGWLIMPNLLEQPRPKIYAAGGWLIKEKNSWQEFMAGGLFCADGSVQPALNFRTYSSFIKAGGLDFYSGFMLRPDRAIVDPYVTYPIGQFRLGLETELTAGLEAGVNNSARLGPRLSIKIPKTSLTFATSALFDVKGGKGDTVVRTYLLFNF